MAAEQPKIVRDGWYRGESLERYVCTGRGVTAHGPTPKAALTYWWLAQNPWPKNRAGKRKHMFLGLHDECWGGIDGYEVRPQRDGRVYMPLEAEENGKGSSGLE